jgi:hypothetical protein
MAETVARIGNCDGDTVENSLPSGLPQPANGWPRRRLPSATPALNAALTMRWWRAITSLFLRWRQRLTAACLPQTLVYSGGGLFRTDGDVRDYRHLFTKVS